ncbi:6-phosphogluconolactonase [Pusillimonas sp. ANT_WB101]|uniref:6-phosphogluconolactonase n=1 Tax=Pusillimonas sp. ANT_WB101 TaxID=2597356 RepID=UPI0011EFB924|nr:6-phosphogluconolactonase [Pusillimonas sp. ANT_WB101]KAA0910552.1 6-phosphogluconolactonase [Pusillimonas sp. ANT_WB101]
MWHEFASASDYINALARYVANSLEADIEKTGRAGLAVSGGKSPIPLFEALSTIDLPWPAVDIMLVDERFVPVDDPDSNENLVQLHLLRDKAANARFYGLVTSTNLAECVNLANSQRHENITLAILGMGDDGHTASLFPEAPQLHEGLAPDTTQRYLHVTPPSAPHERISMTLPAILSAQKIVIAINGPVKRQVLEKASIKPTPALPISYVVTQTGVPCDIYWHN